MKIAVFAAAALLSGCYFPGFYATPYGPSTTRPEPTPLERLQGELPLLNGLNISVAVDRLGYPTGQREILGDTIYVWETRQQVELPALTSSTTTGAVGNTPYYGIDTAITPVSGEFVCTIQLAVTPEGLIKRWQYNGNNGGCATYANALR